MGKNARKKDRYNKKELGAIGKRESENVVVWITLQSLQFNWKNVNIKKVYRDGTYTMSMFYNNPNQRESFFNWHCAGHIKTTTNVPIVVMLPSILGPIFGGEEKTLWELHRIMKSWVELKDREAKRLVCPILEWLIWSCVKGINKDKSATETDMTVVTLPHKKLKSWQKMQL